MMSTRIVGRILVRRLFSEQDLLLVEMWKGAEVGDILTGLLL
jgi:hypothetical protein